MQTISPEQIIQIWLGFVASITALVVAVITWVSTSRQIKISRHTLFTSLLPRRQEWLEKFQEAISSREVEINSINLEKIRNGIDQSTESLFYITNLRNNASWMFDESVVKIVDRIIVLLREKTTTIIEIRAGEGFSSILSNLYLNKAFEIINLRSDLTKACQPFLYVGDVRRRRFLWLWWR
jgi:hypothetical protein